MLTPLPLRFMELALSLLSGEIAFLHEIKSALLK